MHLTPLTQFASPTLCCSPGVVCDRHHAKPQKNRGGHCVAPLLLLPTLLRSDLESGTERNVSSINFVEEMPDAPTTENDCDLNFEYVDKDCPRFVGFGAHFWG